jgi:hypothetical protein
MKLGCSTLRPSTNSVIPDEKGSLQMALDVINAARAMLSKVTIGFALALGVLSLNSVYERTTK